MFIIKILLHHLGHRATFENELHLLQHYEPNKNVSNCKIFGQVEPVEKFFSLCSGPPGYFFLVSILTRNILYTISWKVPPSDTNQDTFVGNIVKTFVLGSILIEN